MIPNQRHLFDIPADVVYMNCASHSPLLRTSFEAGQQAVMRKAHPWGSFREDAAAECETLRGLYARLIGASERDIAIVPSTSYGIATAAANLPVARGQKIVVLQDQFPSNYHAWVYLALDKGAELVTVPRPADGDWTSAILERIDGSTAIAAVPPCHWTDGSLVNLQPIGERCRAVGSAFVIDATQACGARPIDVRKLRPDFLAASGYKWLLCPYTLSFLYAAPHRQNGRSLEHHRTNSANDGRAMGEHDSVVGDGARRYDMGERNNPIGLPMAIAAIEQLLAWDPAEVTETVKPLTDRIAEMAAERGFTVPPAAHRVAHIIGMRRQDGVPGDVDRRLAAKNVHVSLRGDSIRVSPHVFNGLDDVDRLFAALDRAL
ncbi:MAG: aminotransferase class V-fold PLP-dependent enzyme [Alphaproteobacteria bacterium]|nr:aminotransferase class V-fold PLP-dependent enzyme [Alphaproteobacteria bacterium]